MSAMTLEQVSYHLREKKTTADDLLADAINAHLTAHAQMADEVREVIESLRNPVRYEMVWILADKLARAIGDKP